MTEKRFKILNCGLLGQYIKDNGKILTIEDVVKLLNELDEKWINELNLRETLQLDLQRVEEENKQLKADNNRLVNQTAKIVSEHQKRVLDLIDKKIREYSNLEQRERTSNDTIEILNELKKELVE